jgi:hypothetical protein
LPLTPGCAKASRGPVHRGNAGEAVLKLPAAGKEGFAAMAKAQDTTWEVVLKGVSEQDWAQLSYS